MMAGLQFAMTGRRLVAWRLAGLLCSGWVCVALVPRASGGGEPACGPDTGSCFEAHQNPGCELVACCELVCGIDAFCCEGEWDLTCVQGAEKECDTSLTCPGMEDCHAPHDTPSCEDGECCQEVCAEIPSCCQLQWSEECAELAFELCPCGAPGSGDCLEINETPGCEDGDCCGTICGIDGFCCGGGWDNVCVEEASAFCGAPACELICPAGALQEGEICGQEINAGCNAQNPHDPENPAFTAMACGDTFCGTAFAGGSRDTDWYEVTLTEQTQLDWTVTSQMPVSVIIVAGDCDSSFGLLAESFASACRPNTASACVEPGTYYLFVSPAIEERSLRAGAPCPACDADFNGDGVVGPFDLAFLLGAWGPCDGECLADFNEDGVVGPFDLAFLLGAWGPCGQPSEALWGNDYVGTLTCQPCEE